MYFVKNTWIYFVGLNSQNLSTEYDRAYKNIYIGAGEIDLVIVLSSLHAFLLSSTTMY